MVSNKVPTPPQPKKDNFSECIKYAFSDLFDPDSDLDRLSAKTGEALQTVIPEVVVTPINTEGVNEVTPVSLARKDKIDWIQVGMKHPPILSNTILLTTSSDQTIVPKSEVKRNKSDLRKLTRKQLLKMVEKTAIKLPRGYVSKASLVKMLSA